MDARFVLIEIGRLTSQMENNTKVLDRLAGKVDEISDEVRFAQTTLVVFCAIMTPLLLAAWWAVTTFWPYRTRLEAILAGSH